MSKSQTEQMERKTEDANDATTTGKHLWVGRRRAARELGVDQRTFFKVAEAAGFRTRTLPGMKVTRYFLPDVLCVARASVRGDGPKTGTARAQP